MLFCLDMMHNWILPLHVPLSLESSVPYQLLANEPMSQWASLMTWFGVSHEIEQFIRRCTTYLTANCSGNFIYQYSHKLKWRTFSSSSTCAITSGFLVQLAIVALALTCMLLKLYSFLLLIFFCLYLNLVPTCIWVLRKALYKSNLLLLFSSYPIYADNKAFYCVLILL